MHRQSGRYLNSEYYIELELLSDGEYFSPSDIAKRKFNKKTQSESFWKMFHSIYQFSVRNGLPLFPDNCARHPDGKPILLENGKAKLLPGERSAKWRGETWKSKLYLEDREAIRNYAQVQLLKTLRECLRKRQHMHKETKQSSRGLKRPLQLKKGLWVVALVAAIFFTAGGIYNYSYLNEGYGVLKTDGPRAALEFFQNRGESYDNLFGKAWAAYRIGDYETAEKLGFLVLKSRSHKDQSRAHYLLGDLMTISGRFDKALEHLLTAHAMYESRGKEMSRFRTQLFLAKSYLAQKDLSNAEYYLNLAGISELAAKDHFFLYLKSQLAFFENNYESALNLSLLREKVVGSDSSQLAAIFCDIGFYYGLLGEFEKCLSYTLKTEELATKQENQLLLMYNNVNLYLYLKCTLQEYQPLEKMIVDYARQEKDFKLFEYINFVKKFSCPFPRPDPGHGDPPDDDPPPKSPSVLNRLDNQESEKI